MTMYKVVLFVFGVLTSTAAAAQAPPSASIRAMKGGKVENDNSYVYLLPWAEGKKYFLIQGWHSAYSHKGEFALDFKMKPGTTICAAREGIVESVREDSDKGGTKPENLSDGNYIIIRHNDGSSAHYWHLQKDGVLVNEGDTVQRGQAIGRSGNTGYSAFPHLHFEVVMQGKQIPARFLTRRGVRYIRPGHFYKSVRD